MRLFLAFSISLIAASPPRLFAQQVGDRVGDSIIVTTPEAALRCRNDLTGNVRLGTVLVVKHIDGDWFWVIDQRREETVRGWINRADVVPRARAFDLLSERLKCNPSAGAYAVRANLWREKRNVDQTIADCDQALRLDSTLSYPYAVRALAWIKKGEADRALADCNEALRIDPQNAAALDARASAWMAKAEFDIATAQSLKGPTPTETNEEPETNEKSSVKLVHATTSETAARRPATHAVLERSNPLEKLTLRDVAFCEKIENYGRWTHYRLDEFASGQPILLYAALDNFCSEWTREKEWRTVFKSTITIEYESGGLVQRMPFPPNEDQCNSLRRDYYNSYEFSIPNDCTPGSYTLTLKVEDQLSGKTASSTIGFKVR